MKRFLSIFMASLFVISIPTPASAAQVDLTVKVLDAPTVLYEDFTFEVATVDGADLSSFLDQYDDLAFSFQSSGDEEVVYDFSVGDYELYSVEDLGSKFRVTIDVTGKDESYLDIDNAGGVPSFEQVSIPFLDGDYLLKFGQVSNEAVTPLAQTEFGFVTQPVRMEVYPGAEVNSGDEMYVVVYDDNDNVTALPGHYYISLFNTTDLSAVGTTVDGSITESVLEGLYYFDAPVKAASYRVNLGPLALVPRTDSFDFKVVASAVSPFDPEDFQAEDFDFEGVDMNDPTIPRDIAELFGDDDAEVTVIGEVDLDGFVFDPREEDQQLECGDMSQTYWAYEIINSLLAQDLYPVELVGAKVNCRGEEAVLRKEFTVWLLEAYYPEEVADVQEFHENYDYDDSPFVDVKGDDPYDPYIILASELKIVSGNPDGTFKPDRVINRAEVLKILLRSSELFEATAAELRDLDSDYDPVGRFVDEDNDDWYTPYLHYAVEAEIIEGRTEMRNGRMVRVAAMGEGVLFGEAAKILYLARQ